MYCFFLFVFVQTAVTAAQVAHHASESFSCGVNEITLLMSKLHSAARPRSTMDVISCGYMTVYLQIGLYYLYYSLHPFNSQRV